MNYDNAGKDRLHRILRVFQIYYLSVVCILVICGELFPGIPFRIGRRIENLLVIPFLVAIVLVILERRLKLVFTWRECLLGAFIVAAASGLFYSPYPDVVSKGLTQVGTAAVLYFLLQHALSSKSDIRLFARAFIAGGVLLAIVGIAGCISHGHAVTKTWGNPNTFGGVLLMPIALTLSIAAISVKRWVSIAALAPVLIVLLIGAYLAQSHGVRLGCGVIVVLVAALGGKRGLLIGSAIAVLGMATLFVSPSGRPEQQGFAALFGIDNKTLAGRRENIWPAATQMIGRRPITGYGLNTYREVYEEQHGIQRPDLSRIADPAERTRVFKMYIYEMRANVHPHNELMQAWISMGIAGLFFYGAVFVTVLITYIEIRRLNPRGFTNAMGLGVLAWYAGHMAYGIFHCFFFFSHAFSAASIMFVLMFGSYYFKKSGKVDGDISDNAR